jgi:TRAP-type C4-dicarboxylate transport system substrate-binding protein
METVIVKTKFHELIDKVENMDLLEKFYEAFNAAVSEKRGVWNTLSPDVQSHISKAYEESLDKDNLINHDIVKSQFSKWLSK